MSNPRNCVRVHLLLVGWAVFALAASSMAVSAPKTAPDWRIDLVAQAPEIRHPSVVCVAPDARVFVAEDPMDISTAHADAQQGRIVCLHPDGRRSVGCRSTRTRKRL